MPEIRINVFLAILDMTMNLCQSYLYISAFNYIRQIHKVIPRIIYLWKVSTILSKTIKLYQNYIYMSTFSYIG